MVYEGSDDSVYDICVTPEVGDPLLILSNVQVKCNCKCIGFMGTYIPYILPSNM